ncbi:LysR family transcriptional regulator [Microlunatus flavus]|uniref:LysR family transcriptional regulator n=1 Tax=Microlunatus flavus TaxID=1036181 RepID=UPI000B8192E6|nr:LysR family transcriptional regulator [Microlunatus flavus]
MGEFSLTGLRVVRAVADSGSFTAAAELLGYTQSAVSRQVAATESAAGTSLFRRESRGVVLTPAGAVVARRAGAALEQLSGARRDLAALADGVSGRVVIGAFPTAAAVLVPRTMARLLQAHPGLEVELREGSTPTNLRRLRAGRVDVALAAIGDGLGEHDLEHLVTQVLPGAGMWLAVPADHRLARRDDVTAADLVAERWIVGEGLRSDPHFGAWPTLTDPVVAHSAPSLSTRLGLVAAGLGVALVPSLAAGSAPAGVEVVAVADATWSGRRTVAVVREGEESATRVVVEGLAGCADELLGKPASA